MQKTYSLTTLDSLSLEIEKPSIVFLYWDLGAGKTTMVQSLIQKIDASFTNITSPTYVYYNRYNDIYHFDLYRIGDYDEFVSIWWEEIFDNNEGIIFVEWPQFIEQNYVPDIKISLEKTEKEGERKIRIEKL